MNLRFCSTRTGWLSASHLLALASDRSAHSWFTHLESHPPLGRPPARLGVVHALHQPDHSLLTRLGQVSTQRICEQKRTHVTSRQPAGSMGS